MVCLNSLDEIVFAAIANNQINAGEGRDSLWIEFRVATGNDEQRVGMSAVRLVYKLARTTVAKMRHSAGVDDVDIGHLIEVALLKASLMHLVADGVGIGLVHFTAQGSDGKGCFCL